MYCSVAIDCPVVPDCWSWLKHVFFNTGGPRSRTRRETIQASILGNPSSSIYFPKNRQYGLIFPEHTDPLQFMSEILKKKGFSEADQAKDAYDLPVGILFCRTVKESQQAGNESFLNVLTASADEILQTAIVLCLCNKHFYDFGHSVIWTANRLERKLTLYEVGNFYADD